MSVLKLTVNKSRLAKAPVGDLPPGTVFRFDEGRDDDVCMVVNHQDGGDKLIVWLNGVPTAYQMSNPAELVTVTPAELIIT